MECLLGVRASLVVQMIKNLLAMKETPVSSLSGEKISGEGNDYTS